MNQYYQQSNFSSPSKSNETIQPRRRSKRRVIVPGGPKPPKRPVNGYILYSIDRRTQLRAEHSSKVQGKCLDLPMREALKIIGEEWGHLPPEEKKWNDKTNIAKQQYNSQMNSFSIMTGKRRRTGGMSAELQELMKLAGVGEEQHEEMPDFLLKLEELERFYEPETPNEDEDTDIDFGKPIAKLVLDSLADEESDL